MSEAFGPTGTTTEPKDLSPLGRLALEASLHAANTVQTIEPATLIVETKSSHRDLVTDLDRAVERTIVETISAERPNDTIEGEEQGKRGGNSSVRWLIDPIDGTTNFVHRRPDYAVAVGAKIDGVTAVGAIVKPATGEWMATDEKGVVAANLVTPGVAKTKRLSETLISVAVSIDKNRRPITLSTLLELLPQVRDFRRTGSTSCDLLAVATGSLDAYVGIGTKEWDITAGWALVAHAGGTVQQLPGTSAQDVYILAAPGISDPLTAAITQHTKTFTTTADQNVAENTNTAPEPTSRPTRQRRSVLSRDVGPHLDQ